MKRRCKKRIAKTELTVMKLTFRIQKIEVHKDMYRVIYPKDCQGFEADFSD